MHTTNHENADPASDPIIRSIDLTETFQEEDTVELTAEELKEAQAIQEEAQLRRRNPAAYQARIAARQKQQELEYRQRYPQAYAQANLQKYPQDSRYAMPANAYGAPSGVLPNRNITNGYPTQHNGPVSVYNPYVVQASAHSLSGPVPSTPYSSNITPILGANTVRKDLSLSLEKQDAPVAPAHQAESEPHPNRSNTITDDRAPGVPNTQSEQPRASASALGRPTTPDSSVETPKRNDTPRVPPVDVGGHRQKSMLDTDPDSPSPAPTLKRKLSESSAQQVQQPDRPRSGFGFPSLNKLFTRETSKNPKSNP